MLIFERINTGKVHEDGMKWGRLWSCQVVKWAAGVRGCTRAGEVDRLPAKTLFTGKEPENI